MMLPWTPSHKEKEQMKGIRLFQGILSLVSLVLIPFTFFEQYRIIGYIGLCVLFIPSTILFVLQMKTGKKKK